MPSSSKQNFVEFSESLCLDIHVQYGPRTYILPSKVSFLLKSVEVVPWLLIFVLSKARVVFVAIAFAIYATSFAREHWAWFWSHIFLIYTDEIRYKPAIEIRKMPNVFNKHMSINHTQNVSVGFAANGNTLKFIFPQVLKLLLQWRLGISSFLCSLLFKLVFVGIKITRREEGNVRRRNYWRVSVYGSSLLCHKLPAAIVVQDNGAQVHNLKLFQTVNLQNSTWSQFHILLWTSLGLTAIIHVSLSRSQKPTLKWPLFYCIVIWIN